MILRRSPDALTLVTYDGYVHVPLGFPVPWRVLWHEGSQGWTPGDHLDDTTVQAWPYLGERPADSSDVAKELAALRKSSGAEILRLKKELKKAGKAYGRASAAIGDLRRDLALARLYRTCWAKAKASDCSACRAVFHDEAPHEHLPNVEPLGAPPRRKLPRSLGMGKNGPADLSEREPGVARPMTMEHFGPVNDSDAAREAFAELVRSKAAPVNAAVARMQADAEAFEPVCAAAFTDSGRDTGHSLCGSPEGPITSHDEDTTCFDCVQLLTNGWDED